MVANILSMSTKLVLISSNTIVFTKHSCHQGINTWMDDSSLIDVNTFASLYPIFYFDLTAQDEDLYKSVKYAELEVRWSNQAQTVAPTRYYLWAIYESERVIKFEGYQVYGRGILMNSRKNRN